LYTRGTVVEINILARFFPSSVSTSRLAKFASDCRDPLN